MLYQEYFSQVTEVLRKVKNTQSDKIEARKRFCC